jgi:hypothetical protein
MLIAIAGGLLLFGAAQHLLARTMSLVVGVALIGAAIIALASNNVVGLAAANHWTELGWAVVGVILLVSALLPRRPRTVVVEEPVASERVVAPAAAAEPVTSRDPALTRDPGVTRDPGLD